jgi:hypothetical protein
LQSRWQFQATLPKLQGLKNILSNNARRAIYCGGGLSGFENREYGGGGIFIGKMTFGIKFVANEIL